MIGVRPDFPIRLGWPETGSQINPKRRHLFPLIGWIMRNQPARKDADPGRASIGLDINLGPDRTPIHLRPASRLAPAAESPSVSGHMIVFIGKVGLAALSGLAILALL
jgi:hypothetical protein